MRHLAVIYAIAVAAVAIAATASASPAENFRATFHDNGSSNCSFPLVFCGDGVLPGYGHASRVVRATGNAPIAGTDCSAPTGIGTFTLDDGRGSLVFTFEGIRCPLGPGANAYRVTFTWSIDPGASTGIFAGATGTGTGENTATRNSQVATMNGSLALS